MKNPIQKSFAIVTLAIGVFLMGRLYLTVSFESPRLHDSFDPFVDWATNFVSAYLLVFGYSLFILNFAWRRTKMLLSRTKMAEQQPQESVV